MQSNNDELIRSGSHTLNCFGRQSYASIATRTQDICHPRSNHAIPVNSPAPALGVGFV